MRSNFTNVFPGGNQMISGADGGGVLRILPRTTYTVTTGGGPNVVFARYISTPLWVTAVLKVRVHARNTPTGGGVTVQIFTVSFSDEDPSLDFVADSSIASAAISSTVPANVPGLVPVQLSTPIGAMLRGILTFQAPGSGTAVVTVSADLVGRPSG